MTSPVPPDPIGLIRPAGLPNPAGAPKSIDTNGKEFGDVLRDQLEAVNASPSERAGQILLPASEVSRNRGGTNPGGRCRGSNGGPSPIKLKP